MSASEKAITLLTQSDGYISSSEARTRGVSNKTLQRLAKRGLLVRLAQGLYADPEVFPDRFRIAQYRCPKGVFSHETALFLHGFSDRDPFKLTMTIPSGWNTPLLKDDEMRFFYCRPQLANLGVCEVEIQPGIRVRAYDIERSICDCIKAIDKLDRDLVLTALKQYAAGAARNNAKLLGYADALKMRDTMFRYLEVL